MAIYIGPEGEVDAIQLIEDYDEIVKKGSWLTIHGTNKCFVAKEMFKELFKQKYPRPVQEDINNENTNA